MGGGSARRRTALLVAEVAILGAAVGLVAQRQHHAPTRPARAPLASAPGASAGAPARPLPGLRRSVIRPARGSLTVGQTATVADAATSAKLQITVGAPTAAYGPLGSYGYGPQDGRYLSFPVRVRNAGSVAVLLRVRDFVVDEPGLPGRTVDDGNSPYSGAPRQLDNTVLAPGQQVSGLLTYDEPGRHGRLRWVSGGVTACSWSF